ncbi:MAG: hypothetical protein JNL68_05865 [Burkholderiales bacterium]|nr:hypothetical protein [Burkholderiales bacterium]
MKKLALGLLLSLTLGAAHAAYDPQGFDVKKNYVVNNPNRGEHGRNFFLNFVREVRNTAAQIKNNVSDNLKATSIGRSIGGGGGGGSAGGGGGGGGGICR